MPQDWRLKWSEGTRGHTDAAFPFGLEQLNGDGAAATYVGQQLVTPCVPSRGVRCPTDPDFATGNGFAPLRWAQSAGYGYAPNRAMSNVFMAVILDTPNPSGGVHSMYKQPAGSRLAREALKLAYGMDSITVSPRVAAVALSAADTATITLDTGGAILRNQSGFGFEVLIPLADKQRGNQQKPNTSQWINAPIQSASGKVVTIGSVPPNATRVRYLWWGNPCGLGHCSGSGRSIVCDKMAKCPVYITVQPLGALSGELDFLPLGPFVSDF